MADAQLHAGTKLSTAGTQHCPVNLLENVGWLQELEALVQIGCSAAFRVSHGGSPRANVVTWAHVATLYWTPMRLAVENARRQLQLRNARLQLRAGAGGTVKALKPGHLPTGQFVAVPRLHGLLSRDFMAYMCGLEYNTGRASPLESAVLPQVAPGPPPPRIAHSQRVLRPAPSSGIRHGSRNCRGN